MDKKAILTSIKPKKQVVIKSTSKPEPTNQIPLLIDKPVLPKERNSNHKIKKLKIINYQLQLILKTRIKRAKFKTSTSKITSHMNSIIQINRNFKDPGKGPTKTLTHEQRKRR